MRPIRWLLRDSDITAPRLFWILWVASAAWDIADRIAGLFS